MTSNFLGDPGQMGEAWRGIISAGELMAREGVELHKSMNFRDNNGRMSVFLVLKKGAAGRNALVSALPASASSALAPVSSGRPPRAGSEDGFTDEWEEDSELYTFEGHDSTTVENGKSIDQIAMYPDGRLSDNGKFLKAATNFKDGVRREPLQVQIYEKLDPGVLYDKGIFNLVESKHVKQGGRKVYKFYLNPAGTRDGRCSEEGFKERMISATDKEAAWLSCRGRCGECKSESNLNFVKVGKKIVLRCSLHGGAKKRGLLD